MPICPSTNTQCQWQLRSYTPREYPQLQALLKRAFPHMEYHTAQWEPAFTAFDVHVLKDRDRDVGMFAISRDKTRSDVSWLNFLAVDPEFHGTGVGDQLLCAAEQRAREIYGTKEMHLHTEAKKPQNVNFYMSREWKPVKLDVKGYPDSPSLELAKILKISPRPCEKT